jgi:hypothetical protein
VITVETREEPWYILEIGRQTLLAVVADGGGGGGFDDEDYTNI